MNEVELTISAGRKEPGSLRLVFTLALAGMLSGLAVAGVYQITKPIIDANKARALREAVFEVVPGSAQLQRLAFRDGRLVPLGRDETTTDPVLYAGYDAEDNFLGYAIDGSGPGYQDIIHLIYGYDPQRRRVIGMQVLESRETPGLGDRIYRDEAFVAQFSSLAVEPAITVVKEESEAPNAVDAITGATISSKAVIEIINAANGRWLDRLPPAGAEPPAPEGKRGEPMPTSDDGDAAGEGS
ncbi:MAG: FMN-binding protein [Planctomycetota bacterium]|nr:FMN-binding protein [Planctomycetota bacterium]